ncbi:hypothetical protein GCM10008983_05930 [Lentibacillus halophilus]|uniref:T1SS secreted agglutinin RTX n=1 Tax=Lentibacillus halophilus TaxID=295065 RepID=A0ABN0Z3X3_9BACI
MDVEFDPASNSFYIDTEKNPDAFKVDDEVTVTFLHDATGLKETKTLTVVSGAHLDSLSLGDVELPEDTNMITEDLEGVKVPYTAQDQYGNEMNLEDNANNVEMISSDSNIVDTSDVSFVTEDDETKLNVAKFGDKTGTATITLLNKVNGETATVTFDVNEEAGTPYAVTLDDSATKISKGGSKVVGLNVMDKYGNEVDPDDYVGKDDFTLTSTNDSVVNPENKILGSVPRCFKVLKWTDKAEVLWRENLCRAFSFGLHK